MRTCTKCQAPLFEEPACIICGTPASVTAAPVPAPAAAGGLGPGRLTIDDLRSQPAKEGPLSEGYACALCYLFLAVSGLFMLLWPAYKRNKQVRFHAIQSILLTPMWMWAFSVIALFGPEELKDKLLWGLQLGMLFTWFFMVGISAAGRSVSLPVLGYLARKEL